MSPARFWIREASGRLHEGVGVHGAGGPMSGKDAGRRMKRQIELSNAGRSLLVFEPRRGHVLGYVQTACGDENAREIDLRGATLGRVEI